MTYRDPVSGRMQEVGEGEVVKRRILEQAGWRPVNLPQPEPAAPTNDQPSNEQPAKRRRKGAGA